MAKNTRQASQYRVKRESKAQNDRSPMLAVSVPRRLYRALQREAKAQSRTLADFMRLNLYKLTPNEGELWLRAMNKKYEDAFVAPTDDAVDPHAPDLGTLTTREKEAFNG